MSILMSGIKEFQDVVLCAQDYPLDFVNGRHPEDYVVQDELIVPQFIYHHNRGRYNRLWWRVSWQLPNGQFMATSFLLDTGAPKHIYLSEDALRALEATAQEVVKVDNDIDLQYVVLFDRKCPVEPTPDQHNPENIIGLKLLKRFGLELFDGEPHLSFRMNIPYLSAASI